MFSGRRNISVDVAYNGRILDTGNIDPDIFFAIFPEFRLPGREKYNFVHAARLLGHGLKDTNRHLVYYFVL
jgi:hypothetical protein